MRASPIRKLAQASHPHPSEDRENGNHRNLIKMITEVSTKIRLIIFFTTKDGKALYSQQKQHPELNVAQVMSSLLHNSDLN